MNKMKLRKRIPINYFEPDEPNFDEYVYCDKCGDFVYEYCSIHGPLLVIPDDQIYEDYNKPKHAIDASDANASNWMRYVNCARHWHEQNLIAYQYQGQIYYRTIKIIPRFTELMVFYGSEFAKALNISLRHYNSEYFFPEITGQKINKKECIQLSEERDSCKEKLSKDLISQIRDNNLNEQNNYVHGDKITDEEFVNGISIDHFVFIDDEIETEFYNNTDSLDRGINANHSNETTSFGNEMITYGSNETTSFGNEMITYGKNETNRFYNVMKLGHGNETERFYNVMKLNYSNETARFDSEMKQEVVSVSYDKKGENFRMENETNLGLIPKDMKPKTSCNICFKTLCHSRSVRRHLKKVHSVTENFKCDECEFTSCSQYTIFRHKNATHAHKNCPFCNKEFALKHSLNRHIRNHMEVRKYNCSKCLFKTDNLQSFDKHLKSHITEKIFQCDSCSFSSMKRRNITKHVKIHF